MAIKEFIIGPQNYFEEGYFDGDYTEPNVSKASLLCNANRTVGFQVLAGFYFEEGYFDGDYTAPNITRAGLICDADLTVSFQFLAGFYFEQGFIEEGAFGVNSVIFTLTADAMIVQEATVASGYYSEGYYANGYYEYRGSQFSLIGELEIVGEDVFATGTWTSEATMAITISKTVNAESAMAVEFVQTALGARDRDIDLFAFSDAAIAVEITVTRTTNIELTSVFDIATDGRRFRDVAAAEESLFDFDAVIERSREFNIETQAAFSFDSTAERVRPGDSVITSEFTVETLVLKTTDYTASLENEFALSATVVKVTDINSNVSSDFTVLVQAQRLKEIVLIAFNFASINAIPFVRSSSSSEIQVDSTVNVISEKITDTQSLQTVSTDFGVINQRLRNYEISASSLFAIEANNQRIRDNLSSLQSEFSLTAVIGKQQGIDLYAFSNNSLTADPVVIRTASATLQVSADSTATATRIPQIDISISSQCALIATTIRVRFASSALLADGAVLSLVDVIPGSQALLTASFITNRPYAEEGYVEDDYATNFSTIANYIVDNLQQLTSAFTVIVDGDYAVNGASLLASSGTVNVDGVIIASATSNQQSEFTATINANKSVETSSTIQSQFSVFARIGTQNDIFLTAFSNGLLLANANKTANAISDNSIVSTFFADTADSLSINGQSNLLAAFTSSTAISKIIGFDADLQASGFTITVGNVSTSNITTLSSAFDVDATARVIRNSVATASVVCSLSASIGRIRTTTGSISSALTFVVAIRDLRLDEIVYVIPGENYVYQIVSETRQHNIYGETRIRSVTGESRNRRITGESRIHIID